MGDKKKNEISKKSLCWRAKWSTVHLFRVSLFLRRAPWRKIDLRDSFFFLFSRPPEAQHAWVTSNISQIVTQTAVRFGVSDKNFTRLRL